MVRHRRLLTGGGTLPVIFPAAVPVYRAPAVYFSISEDTPAMATIVILGAGVMGSAFTFPLLDRARY